MASSHSLLASFSTYIHFISPFLLLVLLVPQVDARYRNDEVRTLLKFLKQIIYAEQMYSPLVDYRTGTESDENPCAWLGVTCTNNFTVWELDLSGWGILLLPSMEMLSDLKDVRQLDLSFNSLGEFPDGLGNLTGLSRLDISHNNLFGGVAAQKISACRNLRFLSLSNNNIDGSIPHFPGLRYLQFLHLANNYFSGPIPEEMDELPSLASLDLSNNWLNGSVPALPHLTKLVELKLNNNQLTEFEWPWVRSANSSLQYLNVSMNLLNSPIPSSLAHLAHLRYLDLSHNHLSGEIPSGFGQHLNNLTLQLDLSDNHLTGNIPDDLMNSNSPSDVCPSVNLSNNLLTGNLRVDSSKYRCFSLLDLSYNNLTGPLPTSIFNQTMAFGTLLLRNNLLSGDLVDILLQAPGLQQMSDVRLQNNLFTGDLSRIAMRGLPSRLIREEQFLGFLDLSNNNLRWTTSQAVLDPITATFDRLVLIFPSLLLLKLGGNNFSGTSLPTKCFLNQSNPWRITALDLSNSHLHGEISATAFNSLCVPNLCMLNLSNNDLTGPIPKSIITLPLIQELDVSNNHLSGPLPLIPPESPLNDRSLFQFEGNTKLCGSPLPPCSQAFHGAHVSWWVLSIIIGGSVTVPLLSCLAATWRWRIYSKQHQQDADLIKTLMERDSASLMPLREIRKATDNFADSAQIGEGGFGKVYTGKLCDGTIVAIKRSKREGSEDDKQQFLNEVRILSQVNHRHLVKLLGCCLENKIAVLVFEFVSNGTLQEHLESKPGAARLSWAQRLQIAVHSADALSYLHSAATFPIYHRDVKSANILLDEDLNAKVADFGISRLAPLEATHVSTIAVQGTLGYIDPEYYTSYQLTDKSDVYSFGVVLLELISAKPALDFRRGGDDTSLVNLAGPYIARGNLEGFIDPSLTETYGEPTGQGGESIMKVGRLAMKCLDMRSKTRPSSKEVLQELENLSVQFTGGCKAVEKGVFNSINKDEQRLNKDDTILLSECSSGNSAKFGMHRNYVTASEVLVPKNRFDVTIESEGQSCIQMSQFSRLRNFTN